MDIEPEIVSRLVAWANRNASIAELWLFGSRAKGTSRADSDVDLAVTLTAPVGEHNWALGNYVALCDRQWRPELQALVGNKVSFGAMTPGDEMDIEVRSTGVRLWKRSISE